MDVSLEVLPGFDFGAIRPWVRRNGDHYLAMGGPTGLLISGHDCLELRGRHRIEGTCSLRKGVRKRLSILDQHGLKLKDITDVIDSMTPFAGALDFLNWLRSKTQVVIVSDTYVEFAKPLMAKLGWPTLFCNSLKIDASGAIADYILRQPDGKRRVVLALQGLNFQVVAMGDSYNDISMLQTAQHGLLFKPPQTIKDEYPDFPVFEDYASVQEHLSRLWS